METGEALEWRWGLVGNVIESHLFGEEKEVRIGSKHFSPGTKLYLAPAQWGDGYEDVIVMGKPRHGAPLIEVIMHREYIENFRLKKIYAPIVISKMNNSEHIWWGNSEEDKSTIMSYLEWLNK